MELVRPDPQAPDMVVGEAHLPGLLEGLLEFFRCFLLILNGGCKDPYFVPACF
jgi:hypothetical protein